MSARRVGLLGGSFDPVHDAHLELARRALDQASLHELWLLPALDPPHKGRQLAPAPLRLQMLRAAIGGLDRLAICTLELDDPTLRYSADTVEALAASRPGVDWAWIVGEDSFASLGRWHEPQRLLARAELWVCPRRGGGVERPDRWRGHAVHWLEGDPVDLSSTAIRAALARGERPAGLPAGALDTILEHGLYGAGREPS